MLHFKLTQSRLHKLKLATANLGIVAIALVTFSPVAYADTQAPADRSDLQPVAVSAMSYSSTQAALDKLQQLAMRTQRSSVMTDLPELERDGFWATSQSTLDKIAAHKRALAVKRHKAAVARHKAALARHKAAVAKRKVAKQARMATAPTGVIQAYAHQRVLARGWSESNFTCLVKLWNKESGWNPKAENGSSGAYGIPQALPGSKMATAGSNWRNDYRVQINWGLGYIASSYGTPCAAWSHSQSVNWY